jgi:hypothetical protein
MPRVRGSHDEAAGGAGIIAGVALGAPLPRSMDEPDTPVSTKLGLQVWPHNEAARALYRKFGFVEEAGCDATAGVATANSGTQW